MTRRKRPSKALLKELKELFEKHDWPGTAIGTPAATAEESGCPPGQTPHDVTVMTPDGTVITRTVCL